LEAVEIRDAVLQRLDIAPPPPGALRHLAPCPADSSADAEGARAGACVAASGWVVFKNTP